VRWEVRDDISVDDVDDDDNDDAVMVFASSLVVALAVTLSTMVVVVMVDFSRLSDFCEILGAGLVVGEEVSLPSHRLEITIIRPEKEEDVSVDDPS